MPILSVIIASLNGEATVARAVRSCIALGPDVETIVVDDCSTDSTAAVARSEGATVVTLPVNKGRSSARNIGFAASSGRYITFLDDDDNLTAAVALAVLPLLASSHAHIVRSGVTYTMRGSASPYQTVMPVEDLCQPPAIPGSFFVRRDLFSELGGYSPELSFGENTDLLLRAHLALTRPSNIVLAEDVTVEHLHRPDVDRHYADARTQAATYLLSNYTVPLGKRHPLIHQTAVILTRDLIKQGRTAEAIRVAFGHVTLHHLPSDLARVCRGIRRTLARTSEVTR